MKNFIKKNNKTVLILFLVEICIILSAILFKNANLLLGVNFWVSIAFSLYMCRPKEETLVSKKEKWITIIILIITILVYTIPMSWSPFWSSTKDNGTIATMPIHQYEVLTESFLNGKLTLDYENLNHDALDALENPYSYEERSQAGLISGVDYAWDHAYYNGNYYMYFGVVPIILLFLPFRLITGLTLPTYCATQIFVMFTICGIFGLFFELRKKYFSKMPTSLFLMLSASFSGISIWYATFSPALYCTAITSGICMVIWSIYFYFKSVYVYTDENTQIKSAALGALFGALAFGCRPTIALTNIVVIPMLITFLKQHQINKKMIGKLCLAASPYVFVAIGLMIYNYARFGSPFDFGQTYQLTIADIKAYSSNRSISDSVTNILIDFFIYFVNPTSNYHIFMCSGVFVQFPIFLFSIFALNKKIINKFKEHNLLGVIIALFLTIILIVSMIALNSPYAYERYKTDFNFIICIFVFVTIGFFIEIQGNKKITKATISIAKILCVATIIITCCLMLIPTENGFTVYYPEILKKIKNIILFT